MLLAGDTAIVTGATGLLGRAIAGALTAEGAKVVATDIDPKAGNALVRNGAAGWFVEADLAQPASADTLFQFALDKLSRISLFVHCANPDHRGRDLNLSTEADWDSMFNVNLFSAFRLSRALGQHMKAQSIRGRMVFITSLHADSYRGVAHYSSAKAALTMLTRELAVDLGPDGIRVNALAPGMIASPVLPIHEPFARAAALRRVGTPEEFANVVIAVLSERFGSFISGTVIAVDGGLSLFNWVSHPYR